MRKLIQTVQILVVQVMEQGQQINELKDTILAMHTLLSGQFAGVLLDMQYKLPLLLQLVAATAAPPVTTRGGGTGSTFL